MAQPVSARPPPRGATPTGTPPESLLETWGPREDSDAKVYAALTRSRTVFYTPEVKATHKALVDELGMLTSRVDICIDQHLHP